MKTLEIIILFKVTFPHLVANLTTLETPILKSPYLNQATHPEENTCQIFLPKKSRDRNSQPSPPPPPPKKKPFDHSRHLKFGVHPLSPLVKIGIRCDHVLKILMDITTFYIACYCLHDFSLSIDATNAVIVNLFIIFVFKH